jgi:hypothetical protein
VIFETFDFPIAEKIEDRLDLAMRFGANDRSNLKTSTPHIILCKGRRHLYQMIRESQRKDLVLLEDRYDFPAISMRKMKVALLFLHLLTLSYLKESII